MKSTFSQRMGITPARKMLQREAIDEELMNGRWNGAYVHIREHFFQGPWWRTYDLLEFLVRVTPEAWVNELKFLIGVELERENAAYRLVGEEIVEVTAEVEIAAIEEALASPIRLPGSTSSEPWSCWPTGRTRTIETRSRSRSRPWKAPARPSPARPGRLWESAPRSWARRVSTPRSRTRSVSSMAGPTMRTGFVTH